MPAEPFPSFCNFLPPSHSHSNAIDHALVLLQIDRYNDSKLFFSLASLSSQAHHSASPIIKSPALSFSISALLTHSHKRCTPQPPSPYRALYKQHPHYTRQYTLPA